MVKHDHDSNKKACLIYRAVFSVLSVPLKKPHRSSVRNVSARKRHHYQDTRQLGERFLDSYISNVAIVGRRERKCVCMCMPVTCPDFSIRNSETEINGFCGACDWLNESARYRQNRGTRYRLRVYVAKGDQYLQNASRSRWLPNKEMKAARHWHLLILQKKQNTYSG